VAGHAESHAQDPVSYLLLLLLLTAQRCLSMKTQYSRADRLLGLMASTVPILRLQAFGGACWFGAACWYHMALCRQPNGVHQTCCSV